MSAPISAFALHIWDSLNIKCGVSLERKLAGLKRIQHRIGIETWFRILQACNDQYEQSNSAQFIYAMSHRGSFDKKMEFLANLPGM